ncbi:hypothetical protein HDU83_003949 [Entophlyctis luteolus]|nr:hypothetical protein HDU83_003949 [Entophlyctis luteolus]
MLQKMVAAEKIEYPSDHWKHVSIGDLAKSLCSAMLRTDPAKRISAREILMHPWIHNQNATWHELGQRNVLDMMKSYNTQRKLHRILRVVQAAVRFMRPMRQQRAAVAAPSTAGPARQTRASFAASASALPSASPTGATARKASLGAVNNRRQYQQQQQSTRGIMGSIRASAALVDGKFAQSSVTSFVEQPPAATSGAASASDVSLHSAPVRQAHAMDKRHSAAGTAVAVVSMRRLQGGDVSLASLSSSNSQKIGSVADVGGSCEEEFDATEARISRVEYGFQTGPFRASSRKGSGVADYAMPASRIAAQERSIVAGVASKRLLLSQQHHVSSNAASRTKLVQPNVTTNGTGATPSSRISVTSQSKPGGGLQKDDLPKSSATSLAKQVPGRNQQESNQVSEFNHAAKLRNATELQQSITEQEVMTHLHKIDSKQRSTLSARSTPSLPKIATDQSLTGKKR